VQPDPVDRWGHKDGFKRGTNYIQRSLPRPDPAAELFAVANQQARCARGEHDEAVAKKGYVTYLGYGKRIEPGTRYCRFCKVILADGEPAREESGDA